MSGSQDIYEEFSTPTPESVLSGFDDTEEQGASGNENEQQSGAQDGANSGQSAPATQSTGEQQETQADDHGAQGGDTEDQNYAPVIPRARFNEVNQNLKEERLRNQELEAQLLELKSKASPSETGATIDNQEQQGTAAVNIQELERQYLEAFDVGDTDMALEIREKINTELERRAEERALTSFEKRERERTEATARQVEQENLRTAAFEVVGSYPVLNTNKELLDDVLTMRDFIATRDKIPLDKALRKAADLLCPTRSDGEQQQSGNGQQQNPGQQRTQNALGRNLQESGQQPPQSVGAGVRSQQALKQKPSEISQEKWDKMPESDRAEILQ
jgi:hypothetical protein